MLPFATAVSICSLIVAFASLGVAFFSLKTARGLNRAKFLYDLHKDFFVADTYKATLDALDEISGDKAVICLVETENSLLIDLLNAFELVAYFEHTGHLEDKDVDALLGYYLGCIRRHAELRQYIKDKRKSFEHLRALLDKLPRENPHAA